jgi:hypothetical protein
MKKHYRNLWNQSTLNNGHVRETVQRINAIQFLCLHHTSHVTFGACSCSDLAIVFLDREEKFGYANNAIILISDHIRNCDSDRTLRS